MIRKYSLFIILLVLNTNLSQDFYNDSRVLKSQKVDYLVSLPNDYHKDKSKTYPVIVFLHGGDRSNTKHHPKKYAMKAGIDFPFIVIAPHCVGSCNWRNLSMDNLLKEVSTNYRVDKDRIYLTGYSMGGSGSWSQLVKSSKWFAAAAPIAGSANISTLCDAKDVAIRIYHADNDRIISYSNAVRIFNQLKTCNSRVELITNNGGDHWIWPKIYQDPKFYAWLLSNQKQ